MQQTAQRPKKRLELKPEHANWKKPESASVRGVSDSAMYMAKLGKHFGWPVVVDIMEETYDWLSTDFADEMIRAADKVDAARTSADAYTSFVGSVSSQSKKPVDVFKKLTKELHEAAK